MEFLYCRLWSYEMRVPVSGFWRSLCRQHCSLNIWCAPSEMMNVAVFVAGRPLVMSSVDYGDTQHVRLLPLCQPWEPVCAMLSCWHMSPILFYCHFSVYGVLKMSCVAFLLFDNCSLAISFSHLDQSTKNSSKLWNLQLLVSWTFPIGSLLIVSIAFYYVYVWLVSLYLLPSLSFSGFKSWLFY